MERHRTLTSTLYPIISSRILQRRLQMVPLGKKQSVMLWVWSWMVPFSVKNLQSRENSSQFNLVRFFFHKIRGKGCEPNYIIIWHRKHIFVSCRLAFRAFSCCSVFLRDWDMNDYAMCNSHCFLMLSQSVVHLLTDMREVLKKNLKNCLQILDRVT